MKHGKRLNFEMKKLLVENGLNPKEWLYVKNLNDKLVLINTTNEECYQALLDDYIELENKYEDLKEEIKGKEEIIEFLRNENDELYQKTKKLEIALKRSEKE